MLSLEALQNLLNVKGRSNQDRAVLCLALSPLKPHKLKAIRGTGASAGWSSAKSVNLSHYLGLAKGLAIQTPEGWKLTKIGEQHAAKLAAAGDGSAMPPPAAEKLRAHLKKLSNADTRAFVEEAIKCYEYKLYRSAVVLSWVGALALIYDHVVAHKLAEFNTEATHRNAKWKPAKNKDDLVRMKEYDFVQLLPAISVVGKSVKDELENCLTLRNGCGHPNSLQLAEHRVAAHVEVLLLNVFEKF